MIGSTLKANALKSRCLHKLSKLVKLREESSGVVAQEDHSHESRAPIFNLTIGSRERNSAFDESARCVVHRRLITSISNQQQNGTKKQNVAKKKHATDKH